MRCACTGFRRSFVFRHPLGSCSESPWIRGDAGHRQVPWSHTALGEDKVGFGFELSLSHFLAFGCWTLQVTRSVLTHKLETAPFSLMSLHGGREMPPALPWHTPPAPTGDAHHTFFTPGTEHCPGTCPQPPLVMPITHSSLQGLITALAHAPSPHRWCPSHILHFRDCAYPQWFSLLKLSSLWIIFFNFKLFILFYFSVDVLSVWVNCRNLTFL